MIDIAYNELMEQVRRGAFLTIASKTGVNTMTIGWFQVGFFWGREVMTVGVRPSRHTFSFIEENPFFSVTIPESRQFKKELAFCGTKSGRDYDKFDICNLPVQYYGEEHIPYVAIPGEHLFGMTVNTSVMDSSQTDSSLDKYYKDGDYHTLYMAETIGHLKV